MAKCSRCGKHGFFMKRDASGLCIDCHIALAEERLSKVNADLSDKEKLLEEAKNEARTSADIILQRERDELSEKVEKLKTDINAATEQYGTLTTQNANTQKTLEKANARIERLRPLAKSILALYEKVIKNEQPIEQDDFSSIDLSELPELDLQCLSMKALRSKYNSLRKQITQLCADYQSRYTTKANATVYKLMVLALEAEMQNLIYKLQFGKLEKSISDIRELTSRYYTIAADGNQTIAPTMKRFIAQVESLYIDVIQTEYEYYVQRERAKEEQRALKEQMRQEAEERKQLEQEKKRVEAEEKKYQQEIDRIKVQMETAYDSELQKLRDRLNEMQSAMNKVEDRKAEIVTLQNGKAGTVYIISNLGAFGDRIFKIGMTRRLEPQERIDELGNASVPFPFDVHSFIFSQDAVGLEKALHEEFNVNRVNKVNLRKEFFNVGIDELQKAVERIDPTAPFKITMLAEQYRQSMSIDIPTANTLPDVEDEDEDF